MIGPAWVSVPWTVVPEWDDDGRAIGVTVTSELPVGPLMIEPELLAVSVPPASGQAEVVALFVPHPDFGVYGWRLVDADRD